MAAILYTNLRDGEGFRGEHSRIIATSHPDQNPEAAHSDIARADKEETNGLSRPLTDIQNRSRGLARPGYSFTSGDFPGHEGRFLRRSVADRERETT